MRAIDLRFIFVFVILGILSCQEEQRPDPIEQAQSAMSDGDLSGAIEILQNEISGNPGHSDARRLLASVYVQKAGLTANQMYDLLGHLDIDFFPEANIVETTPFVGDAYLAEASEILEQLPLKWEFLPTIDSIQDQDLVAARTVLVGETDPASVEFRRIIDAVILKGRIIRFPSKNTCGEIVGELYQLLNDAHFFLEEIWQEGSDRQWLDLFSVGMSRPSSYTVLLNMLKSRDSKLVEAIPCIY